MALAGAPAAMAAEDEILVAVAGPMTGQYAAFGRAMKFGGEQAVAKINTDGGFAGRKIRLLVEDDACDKAKAVAVAQRMVSEKVSLVVGHHCASASIAAAPIYAAAGVVMISPGTTDPLFTDKRAGPTIYRLAPRDDSEGSVSGAFIARVFAGKRVAVLHDRTHTGMQLAAGTKKAMNAAGLAEVLFTGFIAGERDYSQLARDLRIHRIDIVYLGAYPSEVDLIQAALRSDGQSTTVIASNLLAGRNIDSAKRHEREGMMFTSLAHSDPFSNLSHPPTDISREIYRTSGRHTVAAIQAWAQTSKASTTAATDVASLLQRAPVTTILGEVRFDKKGDALVPFYKIHMWKGDQLVPAP